MSQIQDILSRLRRGEAITPRDAYLNHGCLALHSQIAEIRKIVAPEGLDVVCEMRSSGRMRWGEYRLVATKVAESQLGLFDDLPVGGPPAGGSSPAPALPRGGASFSPEEP